MQPKFQCTLKRRNANLLQLETGHLQLIAQQRHPGFPIQSLRRLFPACRGTAQSQSLPSADEIGRQFESFLAGLGDEAPTLPDPAAPDAPPTASQPDAPDGDAPAASDETTPREDRPDQD